MPRRPTIIGDPQASDEDRERRRIEARLKLAFLPRYDRLIEGCERVASRSDLTEREVRSRQKRKRDQYCRIVGVEMEQRAELAQRLTEAAETGAMTVEEVVATVRAAFSGSPVKQSAQAVAGVEAHDWL